MKTDAQLLQDAIADLQRTAAAQAGPGGGKAQAIEMRVTLSDSGKRTDPDTGEPPWGAVDWADLPVQDAPAAA